MAMLKTLARKFGGCKQIKDYLARNGRAVTFRSSSIDLNSADWDEQMDATRQMFGKDKGRKYYHFVISPDPEDGLDANAVDTLAYDWVRERYSGYQWVIETHSDNGIPHAHIVVNSVNPVDGRKIHLDDDDVQADAMELQRICRDYGYTAFDNFKFSRDEDGAWYARTPRPDRRREIVLQEARPARRHVTDAQRRARYSGKKLWTDAMHDDIESALQGCRTWPALERRLAEKGYRINVNRRGVLTFYPPEGKGHPVKGYKLDDSYTVEGLRGRLAVRLEGQRPSVKMCAEDLVPEVVLPPMAFKAVASNNLERSKRIERSAARLAAAADAVNIIRERGYFSYADMAADARRLAAEVEALDARADALKLEAEQTAEAIRQVEVYTACAAQLTVRPESSGALAAWREDNADELREMEKIRKWMAERGIVLTDTTYTDLLARRDGVKADAANLASAAGDIRNRSRRLSAAVDVLASSQMPVGPTDVRGRGERQKGTGRNGRGAKVITAEQTAELTREYVRNRKAYSEAIAAGALTPDRIKQIERDHERAKAKIISEQREEDLRAERSAYGMAGSEWAQDAPVTVAATGETDKRAKPGWKPYLQRPATDKQMKYLEDLVESGVIAQADIDSLGGEPTIADVNALLNSHPKVKNLELEKRDGDNARDARTYAQTRDDIEDDGYTPANYTRRR